MISPILDNDETVFDHVKKAGIFNSYFAAQCTPFNNDSVLPPFEYKTIHHIKTLSIENETIINIIRSLDSNASSFFLFTHFCPGTITTHAEAINSDLQTFTTRTTLNT